MDGFDDVGGLFVPRVLDLRRIPLKRRFIHRFWLGRPIAPLASSATTAASVTPASALPQLTLACFERFNQRLDALIW